MARAKKGYKPIDRQLVQNVYKDYQQGRNTSKRTDRKAHAKEGGPKLGKAEHIHGQQTCEDYKKTCKMYGKWVEKNYNVHGNMDKAKEHVGTWLSQYSNPSTRKAYAAGLARGFGCDTKDFKFDCGTRHYADVTRGRNLSDTQARWRTNHADVTEALRCCGLRVNEARHVTGHDIYTKDGHLYVHVDKGKGGRPREIRVWETADNHQGADWLRQAAQRPESYPFKSVPNLQNANLHALRAEYAGRMYDLYQSEGVCSGRYYRPRDGSGVQLDKAIMDAINVDLGHGDNRGATLWYNYLSYGKDWGN